MSPEKQITVPVLGMTCANCVASVERNAKKVDGVSDAVVNFASEKVTLTYDPALTDTQAVIERIHRAGYEVPTATVELPLIGMTCANCAGNIQRALKKSRWHAGYQRQLRHREGQRGIYRRGHQPGRTGGGRAQGRL